MVDQRATGTSIEQKHQNKIMKISKAKEKEEEKE